MLSIGLVCALVTGSALLRVRQELFDKPSEQRLRVAASHLSHGDCVTSAVHRTVDVRISLFLGDAYHTDASLAVLNSSSAV